MKRTLSNFLYIILASIPFLQCNMVKHNDNSFLTLKAYAYPYTTAMSKGRGVIFRIQISNPDKISFTADSFFVNHRSMSFLIMKTDSTMWLESDYFKPSPEPALSDDGKIADQNIELQDSVLIQQLYYPSYIVITQKADHKKISIKQYEIVNQVY